MKLRSSALSLSLILSTTFGMLSPEAQATPAADEFTQILLKMNQLDESERLKSIDPQSNSAKNNLWATEDPIENGVEGTSTDKLYRDFKIKADKNEVVVAVIDTGVDIHHEDLKGHIWINLPEFIGKLGVDDDGDGYIDDIYGWNFLGNSDGTNVTSSTLELTRIYKSLQAKVSSAQTLSPEETALLAQVTTQYENGLNQAQTKLSEFQAYRDAITLLKANGLKDESIAGLASVTANDPEVLQAVQIAKMIFSAGRNSVQIGEALHHFQSEVDFSYNLSFDSSSITHDDPNNLNEVGYGNGDVVGTNAIHGTHIAGIIAADRDNKIGINGQAFNVKVMPLRVVPLSGNERDKDVANAIRFAVNHGARVINMSFGKAYSPQKNTVDLAVKYAESMGVILVHAAGDHGLNTDDSQNAEYPTRQVSVRPGKTRSIQTWIEVGASTKIKGPNLPAAFSNYGKSTVDLFAPGEDIISTVPGNQYGPMSGTGQASAEIAGISALILEFYPNATAEEVMSAIALGTNPYVGLSCNQPGQNLVSVNFSDLSVTGGTANAASAMQKMLQTTFR